MASERASKCKGRLYPNDAQVADGWLCECGHSEEPHEVGYDGRWIIETCNQCEKNAEPRVLDVLIEREPLRLP